MAMTGPGAIALSPFFLAALDALPFGGPKGKASKAAKKNGDKAIAPGPVIAIPDPTDNRKTTGTAKAKFFEGATPAVKSAPYRPALADWLTSAKNPYFAPAAVNRLWAHLFA